MEEVLGPMLVDSLLELKTSSPHLVVVVVVVVVVVAPSCGGTTPSPQL